MYVKTINIGSVAGIDEAIAFLEREMSENAIKAKLDTAMRKLLNEAADLATQTYFGFATAELDKQDYPNYSIKATSTSNEDLAFIEFGVGWGVRANNEFAHAEGAPDVFVGSWSRANEGRFWQSNLRYWYYGKTRYTGRESELIARPGMETARQYVVDNWERVMKEVFRFD